MLSTLRKHAASGIIKVILGLIVVVFIFWGFEGFQSDRSGRVGVVNGEAITLDEYRQAYNNLLERYRQQYGEQLNDEFIEMLQLREQALDSLVNQKLMESEAKKLDFRVPDQELAEYIRNIEAFHSEGVFDSGRYREILGRIRMTPEQFEQQQRMSLLIQKLREFIIGNVKVSDDEAMEFFKLYNASVKIKYVMFDPDKYEIAAPDSEVLTAYFEENKEDFKLKPMRKVRYVHLNPEDYTDKVVLSDQEIQEYYDQKMDEGEFTTEKTVEARHILIMVNNDSEEKVWEEKKEQILSILEKARSGEDFAELAARYSEDASKEQGGHLGTFGPGSMLKPFEDVAFSMKAGEISDPVRTQYGWHIIKVENINEAKNLTLEEAREQIINSLMETRSKALAYDDAQVIYQVSFEGDDLVKAAEKHGVDLKTTDFFTDEGPQDKSIMPGDKFVELAFSLSEMEISEITELFDGYYIIQLVDSQESRMPNFEEVNEKVKSQWILAKQDELARQDAESFLERLKSESTMGEISEDLGVVVSESDFFSRNQPIPNIGYEPEISKAAFDLSQKKKYPEEILKGNNGYYVIAFQDHKEPDKEEFEKQKENIRRQLMTQKQMKTFEDWITQIRNNSKISIQDNVITG
jgi:peptidyl-prolyl cis-trans isomerase D